MLRQISQPKCLPVSLEQARKHLSVDSSDRSNDVLINLLIESATADSQMKTGRVWVQTDWEWKPDIITVNHEIAFPIVPVAAVKLYDLDEEFLEPPVPDNPDGPENPDTPPETRAAQADEKEYTDLSDEYLDINYPSPDPMGLPAIGSIIPKKTFPDNYQLVLTVGYPVEEHEEVVEQYDNPVVVKEKTGYSEGLIRIVFNRPVSGQIYISNFELRINNQIITLVDAYFKDGAVELQYDEMSAMVGNGDTVTLSFFEGEIYDQFQNFVQEIVQMPLPNILMVPSEFFEKPDPVPCRNVYESLAPSPVKNWILTRVGSLYSQRTEIALRAGKSNDAMFPEQFINNLLNPYRVRFIG